MSNSHPPSQFDVESVRRDFPILSLDLGGKPLVYLDNAATTQKPKAVIDRLSHYYSFENSNIHRGVHQLSSSATTAYEQARGVVARFIGAASEEEIIFTRGATEAINLVAASWGRSHLKPGDEIVLTGMEHHANIVPWQLLAEELSLTIRVAPVLPDGSLDSDAFHALLGEKTRLVSFVYVSNSLGTVNPIVEMIEAAHKVGAKVLVDGAQAVSHFPVNVSDLDCDFFVFSGHKLFGPTGIGVLYGKRDVLATLPPYQGGGDMIEKVTFEKTTFRKPPGRFEAGTPHIAGVIGLAAAIDYFTSLDREGMAAHETQLLEHATAEIRSIPGIRIVGEAANKVSVLSFCLGDIHSHDIGTILDADGVAIRTGHHCTQPLMIAFGITGTARASFSFYNTLAEVDVFIQSLRRVQKMFG